MSSATIYEANADFPFEQLSFVSPVPIAGGNHFIRCFANAKQSPLYLQPPKCKTKAGIVKHGTGKMRMYCDLVFTHDDEAFLEWITHFESICQEKIYQSREKWFESSLEKHDIENSFSQTMKMYKSGKMYTMRVQIPMRLGKCALKVYNEQEQDVPLDSIQEQTSLVTILEFQGIKCSSRAFQIEVEVKQMMVLNPMEMFESCMFRKSTPNPVPLATSAIVPTKDSQLSMDEPVTHSGFVVETVDDANDDIHNKFTTDTVVGTVETPIVADQPPVEVAVEMPLPSFKLETETETETKSESESKFESESELCEVEIPLDTIPEEDEIMQLKDRNAVYYEMYREAKRKAQIARDLAVASYLEAKRIKNTYDLHFHGEDGALDDEAEKEDENAMDELDNQLQTL